MTDIEVLDLVADWLDQRFVSKISFSLYLNLLDLAIDPDTSSPEYSTSIVSPTTVWGDLL